VADLLLAGLWICVQQPAGGHDHARCAVAALQAVFLPEPLLHRVQLAILFQPLDRGERATVRLHGEHRARLNRVAVEQDRTGAALAGVTADMGAGEPDRFAQEVHQQQSWLYLTLVGLAVHRYRDPFAGHPVLLVLTSLAWVSWCAGALVCPPGRN